MKLNTIILLLLISMKGLAQSNNVQSAANSYRHGEIVNARKFIDLAAENESTANNPKMWYYKARIYLEIHSDSAFRYLDADAIEKSASAFLNCIKTGDKSDYADTCKNLIWVAGIGLFNKGLDAYNKNDYEKANRFYNLIYDIFPYDKDNNLKRNNITPDLVTKNLYFVAYKSKDNAKAKGYLQKLIDSKFNDPKIYRYMSRICLEEQDTNKAISYIEQGRGLFEEDAGLLNEEIRLHIAQGKTAVLIEKLSTALTNTPDNESLYYIRGSLYEQQKDISKATDDYKKAIELKPDYLEANYNIGVIYFNEGAKKANDANSLKSNEEYEKAKKQYELKFKEAEPYLEQALELNTRKTEDDQSLYKNTLQSLKQLYVRTGETEKYNKIKALQEGQ